MKKFLILLAALLIVSSAFTSCNKDKGDGAEVTTKKVEALNLSELDISEYVSLCEYSGIEIELRDGESRGDAVWRYVTENSEIKKYPEAQLEYYFEQARVKYIYLAKGAELSYEAMLEQLGVSEESMREEAKRLTAEDLVFHALLEAENLTLTDADKQNNFDKYVAKFISDYGYSESYVRENMADEIYETMLFDKLLEGLVIKNNFKDGSAAED